MTRSLAARAGLRFVAGAGLLYGVVVLVSVHWLGWRSASHLGAECVGCGLILAVAYACHLASRPTDGDARAWNRMAVAMVLFAACGVVFVMADALNPSTGWLTAAAMLGLAFRVVAAIALVSFPMWVPTNRSRWRARLELAVVASTVAYLAWGWVLNDLFEDGQGSPPAARAALFSLFDIVLVILVLMTSLRRPPGAHNTARWLAAGLFCLALADSSIATSFADGEGATTPLSSISSLLALAFIGIGALIAGQRSTVPQPAPNSRPSGWLPIVLAAIAMLITLSTSQSWASEPLLTVLGITAATLLLAWQVAVLLENQEMVQTLEEQGERFATLVETAPIAIVETDRAGRALLVNTEAARMMDASAADLVGRPLDAVAVDGQTRNNQLRARVLAGETIRDLRLPLVRADGTSLLMLVSAAPVKRRGQVAGVVWIGSDDGPRLRGLAAMIDVQRMDAFEQMAGGISHDFNNRLAVILGSSEILLSQIEDPDQREMLEAIVGAGRRAAGLVEQLASYAQRRSEEPEGFDLNDLLLDLCTELYRRVPTDVTLDIDLDPDRLPVRANWSEVEQAIFNVAANAFEATPPGGHITIAARHATIGPTFPGDPEAEMVEVTVTDSGSGMTPAVRARIFEPFFTTKNGSSRSRGLGLASVQGVVLRSHGTISVDSSTGIGTTVTIGLPLDEPAARPVSPPATDAPVPPAPARTGTILLVDDEPEVRRVGHRVLAEAGHVVVEAGSVDEALEILDRRDDIDLLLSDVVMPGRSGIELAHEFVSRFPDRPVLLLSGFVRDASRNGRNEAIPFPLLTKPIGGDELLAATTAALGGLG